MGFSFAKLYQILPRGGDISARRPEYVFGGMAALGILLVLLLGIDGYMFYVSHLRERESAAPFRRSVSLSPQEIDEVLGLLDAREQKLQTLLGGGL